MANEWVTWAYEQDLPSTRKFVLVVMGDRANHEGYCWPSRKDIAQKTGLSERSVSRAIEELEEAKLIKVVERRRKDGYRSSNGYYLQKTVSCDSLSPDVSSDTESPDNLSPDTESRDNDDNSQGTECQGKDNNKLLSEPSVEPSYADARACERSVKECFEEWYQKYPHKVGEGMARKMYSEAMRKTDPQTLLDGLDRYIRDKPPDQKYCNPATWLKEERWKDQPAKMTGDKHGTGTKQATGNALDRIFGTTDVAGGCGNTGSPSAGAV